MGSLTPDWLTQLAPPHAPPPAGWWPLAPGWWLLLAMLLLGSGGFIYWYTRKEVRLRRIALRELKQLQKNSDDFDLARELEHLLRRYALARYGRDSVAGLSGERWLAFVAAHGGTALSGNSGSSLLRIAYGGTAGVQRAVWLAGAEAFIRSRI